MKRLTRAAEAAGFAMAQVDAWSPTTGQTDRSGTDHSDKEIDFSSKDNVSQNTQEGLPKRPHGPRMAATASSMSGFAQQWIGALTWR